MPTREQDQRQATETTEITTPPSTGDQGQANNEGNRTATPHPRPRHGKQQATATKDEPRPRRKPPRPAPLVDTAGSQGDTTIWRNGISKQTTRRRNREKHRHERHARGKQSRNETVTSRETTEPRTTGQARKRTSHEQQTTTYGDAPPGMSMRRGARAIRHRKASQGKQARRTPRGTRHHEGRKRHHPTRPGNTASSTTPAKGQRESNKPPHPTAPQTEAKGMGGASKQRTSDDQMMTTTTHDDRPKQRRPTRRPTATQEPQAGGTASPRLCSYLHMREKEAWAWATRAYNIFKQRGSKSKPPQHAPREEPTNVFQEP